MAVAYHMICNSLFKLFIYIIRLTYQLFNVNIQVGKETALAVSLTHLNYSMITVLCCNTGRLFLYGEHNKKCEYDYHNYVFHYITPFLKGAETAATVSLLGNYNKLLRYIQYPENLL